MRWVSQSGVKQDAYWYGYTGDGDSPDIARDQNWTIQEKYIQLVGGTLLTIRPTQTGNAAKVYSYPNIHGDVIATANAVGTGTVSVATYGHVG